MRSSIFSTIWSTYSTNYLVLSGLHESFKYIVFCCLHALQILLFYLVFMPLKDLNFVVCLPSNVYVIRYLVYLAPKYVALSGLHALKNILRYIIYSTCPAKYNVLLYLVYMLPKMLYVIPGLHDPPKHIYYLVYMHRKILFSLV